MTLSVGQEDTMLTMPQSQRAEGQIVEERSPRAFTLHKPAQPFSLELWSRIEGTIYRKILAHPFITGLQDGSLPENSFRHYIIQDALYLREYSRALAMVAERAPRSEWATLFHSCSKEALLVELEFHRDYLCHSGAGMAAAAEAEGDPGLFDKSPNTMMYTSHILSTIYERPFHEGLASVLPCFVVYKHVGKELRAAGSPHPVYQRWINQYAGEEFEAVVRQVEAVVDEAAAELTLEQREKMHEQFLTGCRMEYLFWDGAFHRQGWPL